MAVNFLVELGTEELPPKALKSLAEAFHRRIIEQLQEARLAHSTTQWFATPRRLAVFVSGLDDAQADSEVEKLGPSLDAAFDQDGKPSKAAEGFARSNQTSVDALEQIDTPKGRRLCFRAILKGQTSASLLPAMVEQALNDLPIPKRMRWGSSRREFIRPVHWLVMMLNDQVLEAEVLGLQAGRNTRGHRFHCNDTIDITDASAYPACLLEQGKVIADYQQRQDSIRSKVLALGEELGGVANIDPALLDEVTSLVEWPVALAGEFDRQFLDVPAEALVSSMKEHQKYFHVTDTQGKLLPFFITIANIESSRPAAVIAGNEKVIRPRLADAAFFFNTDRKTSLDSKNARLENIVFQQELGSLADKVRRIQQLASVIATAIAADTASVARAAGLCKADLVSEMVGEFEDLQGIMGEYYALHDGEDPAVAKAIREHYLPRHAGDMLPESDIGACLALADRLDTLMGIFAIGEIPSGNKDPFALRRAALGVLNIILHQQLRLDLAPLLAAAQQGYPQFGAKDGLQEQVLNYIFDRFRAHYAAQDISTEVFMAVSAKGLSEPLDFDQRVMAVAAFSTMPEASALAAANKRVSNILEKQAAMTIPAELDRALLQEDAEKALASQLASLDSSVSPLLEQRDYQAALQQLAGLRTTVDQFFDSVMVMVDDPALMANRLCLLQSLRELFLQVADISLLAPKGS